MAISAAWSGAPKEWADEDALLAETLNDEIMSRLLYIYDKMIPVGMVMLYADEYLPASAPFLWCNGAAVSRTTYANLFNVIGTTYGSGDGSTTFNVPDTRGRTIINQGTGSGLTERTIGQQGGSERHVLTLDQLPPHGHGLARGSGSGSLKVPEMSSPAYASLIDDTGYDSQSVGSGAAHNNMQPFVVMCHVIRY